MTEIVLVRAGKRPTSDQIATVLPSLYQIADGLSAPDKVAWRRFWSRVGRLESGELLTIEAKIPRNGRFLRKFFALLNVGFDAWEPNRKRKSYRGEAVKKSFEQFRNDITIMAGFYEQTFNLAGRMKLRAKSIAFANMTEEEFEKVYDSVATVLLEKVLVTYKGRAELDRVVNQIMEFV